MGDYAELIRALIQPTGPTNKAGKDAADAIATLTRELADARAECEGVASEAAKMLTEYLETRDTAIARAEAAEKRAAMWEHACELAVEKRDALRALLREAELVIKLLLNTPEIADCDPRDKDTETQIAERKARDLAARIAAATQTETGGKDG